MDHQQRRVPARDTADSVQGAHDSASVLIWRSGPDKACTYFNDGWLAFTGRSLDQEQGDGWASGVHPDDLAECLETYQTAFDARQEFEMTYRLRRHDGVYRWILDIGAPHWEPDGGFTGYIGSAVDVTEARRINRREFVGPALPRTRHALMHKARGRNVPDVPRPLTPRERDVAGLLAHGLSNAQIAAELVISVATVRVHVEHILAKLDLHSRAQAVVWVLEHGLNT